MERITFEKAVKRVLCEWAEYIGGARTPSGNKLEVTVVFDDEHGHYLLLQWGWDNRRYSHVTLIHLEVRDDKIWIHFDGTEQGVVDDLLAAGVRQKDIVMGWHPADVRQHTPFAVA